jgi:hypothetical protein
MTFPGERASASAMNRLMQRSEWLRYSQETLTSAKTWNMMWPFIGRTMHDRTIMLSFTLAINLQIVNL